jgi:iron complex transport system ATP-binding protein
VDSLVAGYGETQVLHGVDLVVEEGQVCALLGRNGCGKTTLLRCINAILSPRSGSVRVREQEVRHLSRPQIAGLISMVPQSATTVFASTCLEMVLLGETPRLRVWSSPGKSARRRARQVLAEIGIEHLAERPFTELSGGERQLVLLARAFFQDTPVMLLDEPTSHLDFCNQHRVMHLMRRTAKMRGVTVLVTLHDPNLAFYYCDCVAMLRDGRVVAQGPTGRVMKDENLRQVYGDNIKTDITSVGLPVVIPRSCVGDGKRERFSFSA